MFCKVIFGSSLWALVKKEITSDQTWKEAFWKTEFWCVNATHRITRLSSVFSLLTQFSGNLQRDTSERIEAYADKVNIISSKRGRIFLRNFFVIREFLSQGYILVLRKLFANTLSLESAKWDLGPHRGLWWKTIYPQIITREKLTGRLLSVWLHHTEFHLSLLGTVC